MKSNAMQMTGLVLAMAGALTIANAQEEAGAQKFKRQQPVSAAEMIKKFDKDGDSKLSAEELEGLVNEMKSRRGAGGREGAESRGGGLSREEMLKKYDADGDGKLNDEERKAMFEAMKALRNLSPAQ
jgi:Ca2+-binding EF-hand superfamily protein